MKKSTPIFDDYEDLKNLHICDKCEAYWNSTCDGKKDWKTEKTEYCPKGVKESNCDNENAPQKPSDALCRSYIPTRRYFILSEIKRIKRVCMALILALCILAIINIILFPW